MVQVIYKSFDGQSKVIHVDSNSVGCEQLLHMIANSENLLSETIRLYYNGKPLQSLTVSGNDFIPLTIHHLLPGGKGGFGSMLRAIGAQIEKTTNKEACRDLSGRRLRDIKAEKRFKEWMAKRVQDQEEKEKKRKEKLEKMKEEPKILFEDPEYFKNKEEISQSIGEALEHGLKKSKAETSTSDEPTKRKQASDEIPPAKKSKPDLWLGFDLSDDEGENEPSNPSNSCPNTASTSGSSECNGTNDEIASCASASLSQLHAQNFTESRPVSDTMDQCQYIPPPKPNPSPNSCTNTASTSGSSNFNGTNDEIASCASSSQSQFTAFTFEDFQRVSKNFRKNFLDDCDPNSSSEDSSGSSISSDSSTSSDSSSDSSVTDLDHKSANPNESDKPDEK
ncbi:uncharacterized protein LOC141853128 [Brevipalpus obovatus]|uniref:uncharacterized protein LOC141853128 n=1 Tax=Brevipalpus obovatus TaxID=246614 RepID=UPI003D9F2861